MLRAISTYCTESLEELRHVQWPTRRQATRLTVIVIGFILVMSIFFGLIDGFLGQMIRLTLSL